MHFLNNLSGRNAPEWVAGFLRNQWPELAGIGGRLRPESVDGMERNMHYLAKK
jgi:hypothetical protein